MFRRKILRKLKFWKDSSYRKPLILRGARQVGKTSVVQLFGQENFEHTIYINLEKPDHRRLFVEECSLSEFEQIVEIHFNQSLVPGKVLIFIDEIQNCPHLISLLRFFYEERPNLHVIAAGSLLEVVIQEKGISLPVGRIEYMYLYPLDFFEYLEAKQKTTLVQKLKQLMPYDKISRTIHDIALKEFYEYALLGGMPEVVSVYLETHSWKTLDPIYESLLTTYSEDVYKYANETHGRYLRYAMETIPRFAGSIISYEKFGEGHYRSQTLRTAFETLEKIMLLRQIPATESIELPIQGQLKRPKKLLFIDIGLVNFYSGIQQDYLGLKDLSDLYRRRIAEQIVGQHILAQFSSRQVPLYHWARLKAEGDAEVDFCLAHKGKLIGIEVKSGTSSRLRSLVSFASRVKQAQLVRVYSGPLCQEFIEVNGKSYPLLSIPFYLLPRLFKLIQI